MLDFLKISTRSKKNGVTEIYPKFIINNKSTDLMIRGGDFYAIWMETLGLWSTDEQDVIDLVDRELDIFASRYREHDVGSTYVLYLRDSESGMIDAWHKYCQKQMRDNYHSLDETLIFANTKTCKTDYASKKLSYPLEEGDISAYDKLISTLYSSEERHKLEWAIGSIVTGDSKKIQKFLVLYGSAGTGKSTILNIVQKLFEGYYSVFDAAALGSASNSFALEAFKTNPLVAIQHDGNLSRLEDNTRINSLVSHELMTVNEKFKSTYSNRFNAFLFMGTNKPVRITDAKSGLLRRLIDVSPSGKKVSHKEYDELVAKIDFELGAIAYHCKSVYLSNPTYYDRYTPTAMLNASNDFYNFMVDSYHIFKKNNGTTLKAAWEMYKTYCEEAKVPYPFSQRTFKEELRSYFWNFDERFGMEDGTRVRSYYSGFRTDKFEAEINQPDEEDKSMESWLVFEEGIDSIFDELCAECKAQYATENETPQKKWEKCKTILGNLNTSKLHYVQLPMNHIVIDFDIKDTSGKKSFELNLKAALKWPKTYAELSKSGEGIHLHYIYTGDPSKLSRVYDKDIEIKVFSGDSSLRRCLTKCNRLPIAKISSGLPLKGEKKMLKGDVIKSEKGLRNMIKRNLEKEIHPSTKCSIDFINKILNDAYDSGMHYDLTDMKNAVYAFAMQSTNQSDYCIKLVQGMPFKSAEASEPATDEEKPLVFFDCEVFPNLLLVNWKIQGDKRIVRMINPSPEDIEVLIKMRLAGFYCRNYDNHILYARLMGYNNLELFNLSQKLTNSKKGDNQNYKFREAYNLSYTDIYDFASAGNKKSLKKLEIEMGIHHLELGLPWDQPVPEDQWERVAKYCDNDVIATEAAFEYLKGDWIARQILADLTGMSVNDTTNTLSCKLIFGNNRNPQSEFNYRDLSKPVPYTDYQEYVHRFGPDYKFRVWNEKGMPEYRDYIPGEVLPDGWSILPFFPEYTFEYGKSIYLGEEVGEGGRVYSEPGMYGGVWDGDVTGMHPSTIIAEVLFGPRYTKAFQEIVEGRVSIKHQAWDEIDHLFDGKLKPYIQKVINGELTSKELANALKTVVNSVYGLTSAHFPNLCRDPRNKDNIVAKRGALFMTLLTKEVQKRGYTVCHNKTDSIKIPDATPEIQEFVLKFGKEYGYIFETEAEFDRFCLVNDAVYIARTKDGKWTATGKQFAVPYVFKTLFSKELIELDDMKEVFTVKSALYLDFNEKLPDVTLAEKELSKLEDQYKKGKISDTLFEPKSVELKDEIAKGHDYKFIGKAGEFTPVKTNKGGGVLYRSQNGKYYAPSGSTGYRWLESELLPKNESEAMNIIDRSYYDNLVDDAVEAISKYGDFEWFISDEPYVVTPRDDFMNIPEDADEEIPF